MQDYIYSSIAFLAMVIHLIINSDFHTGSRVIAVHGSKQYHSFLMGLFFYYLVDAGWGVLAGLGWTKVLYLDTMLYYIAIAVSVLTCCRFVTVYLELSKWKARTLAIFGYMLLFLYVVLLALNIFTGCLFHFDELGNYGEGPIRGFLFYPLVLLNIIMAGFALAKTYGSRDAVRRRNLVVFLFCISMGVAIVLQILWPLWPFYALGCLVGNCFFHIFVIEDERDELLQAVIEQEQTAKHMAELERALERARAAEKSRSMFFSIVSHDIRTPLNAILGYAELLQDGTESQEAREEALASIRASGTTLLQLVNDVLDLAKMDAGKMTLQLGPVQISHLTDEVFSTFRMEAASKGILLINQTSWMPPLMLDEHRFRQILFNLIGNAVKFTSKGSVTVGATYAVKILEVTVSDTGCGIAPDMIDRVLDPFVQVQDPSHSPDRAMGTGLGLSICRSLVEVMGGELLVDSEPGKGTTFRVRIPGVAASGENPPENPGGSGQEPVSGKHPHHVLVVDDSAVNRSVLTAFLKKAGVEKIDQARDGEEALAELDKALKSEHPCDFVLSDFWMPKMNGLEFIEKLRADDRFRDLPVFAVTADTEFNGDVRSSLFSGILLKPLTYGKLMELFSSVEG